MDCFVAALLAMTSLHFQIRLRILAALIARVLQKPVAPLITEGAGNAGRTTRPQPRVQNEKSTRA
jgi:hypothetical protein